jgi:EpsI family protein
MLMAEVYILRRIGQPGEFRLHYLSLPQKMRFSARSIVGAPGMAALTLAMVMGLVANTGALSKRAVTIPPHAALADFPIVIADWEGRLAPLEKSMLTALNLTDYWSADYVSAKEPGSVNLYIAYYQRQDLNNSIHSPSNCVPAGGWQVVESATHAVERGGNRPPLHVTRMLIKRGGSSAIIYYWFNERGRDITNQYAAKWYLLIDAITMNRSDGSLIRLVTPLGPGESAAEADARLSHFVNAATPSLDSYL